jgi:hypothetical protein
MILIFWAEAEMASKRVRRGISASFRVQQVVISEYSGEVIGLESQGQTELRLG